WRGRGSSSGRRHRRLNGGAERMMNGPHCCAARQRQGTGSRTHLMVPWGVVPKEVGAPARGIGVTLGVTALTPRVEDLTPVLGPAIHPHGPVSLPPPRPRVEVAGHPRPLTR